MRKMTAAERDDTKRIVDLVLEQATACGTPTEARDLGMNFVHGGASALVTVSGYAFTIDFLKKLTSILERQAVEERRGGMN